jgi:hypothetical protein
MFIKNVKCDWITDEFDEIDESYGEDSLKT